MLNDDEMLMGFLEEAREHISTIEPDLLSLEDNPEDMSIINRLFRSVHSIKGGAGFFGLEKMSHLAHAMENLMSKARTSKLTVERLHIDCLLVGLDRLNTMVDDIGTCNDLDITDEIAELEKLTHDSLETVKKAEPSTETQAGKTNEAVEEEVLLNIKEHPKTDFDIPQVEIDFASENGMNIFAVSVYLNQDIMNKGKTPFQFISELEELGRFVDSYLDVDNASGLEECLNDDLAFIFVFSTKHTSKEVSDSLSVDEKLIQPYNKVIKNLHKGPQKEAPPVAQPLKTTEPVSAEESGRKAKTPQIPKEKPRPETPKPLPSVKPALPAVAQKKATELKAETKSVKTDESIRVSVGKLNKLVDLAGELVLVRNQLLQAGEKNGKKTASLLANLQGLNIVTTELQEEILNTRMQPISSVFGKFPRLIRELGSNLGKDISLVTEGNEVELDKTVLEALSDPLTHIIRNTADHGIEMPEERKSRGKPAGGELLLKAYHESGQVIILVKDDGKGIDPDKIAQKAYEKGVISEDDFYTFSVREKINLIFQPGFSTAETVSSVSGRGVGMDVVRSNIEKIGGTVELSSVLGEGTQIKMSLPLTMAIVSCLIVQTEKERYAIPQINLDELVMLNPDDYPTMLGYVQDREVLKLRGDLLPLISLSKGLGLKEKNGKNYKKIIQQINQASENKIDQKTLVTLNTTEPLEKNASKEAMRILVVSIGLNKVGIIVDSIVGSEEIVVKPMPEFLKYLNFFSGATILGDGTVAMILDTLGFVQRNELSFTDRKGDSFVQSEEKKKMAERQSLLIFDNNTEEQFAVTIPLIQRVDEIRLDEIQHIGEKEYIEYRGSQMRILYLADYLSIQKPHFDSETVNIIIPKDTKVPVGIVIYRVIDTKTLFINVTEDSIHGTGILGSTLIGKKITLLLDLFAILEMGEPESVKKIDFSKTETETKTILLVEDTPLFLTIVREYLTSVGFNVKTAMNGVEGLEMMQKEDFDLILSDIEMPEMDGWGLIKAIRSNDKWRDLPVVALTSLNEEGLVQTGLKSGFNEWLVKLDKEKVLDCMNRYLS